MRRERGKLAAAGAAIALLTGCARGCTSSRPPIHLNPSMDDQPKVTAQSESAFFYDGASMRPPVPGTIARGELEDDPAFFEGKSEDGSFVSAIPVPVDDALLARGANRYAIYCSPCHDARGRGKGILFQRGNVPTADLLDAKFREYPDGQVFDVITNGVGLMSGYRWPVQPRDRWAIVAWVRELQRRGLEQGGE